MDFSNVAHIIMYALLLCTVLLLGGFYAAQGCNEAICGSIVSKCMLISSCNCDLKLANCSRECFNCLGYLYTDCCSCVGMCPESGEYLEMLSKKSVVEDFDDPVPELFRALTEVSDERNEWSTEIFPINVSISKGPETLTLNVNCSVMFLTQCVTRMKCRNTCSTMGSSSYRWFHNGCCQCVGPSCVNYGMKESRCQQCPSSDPEEDIDEENELDYDYGEDGLDDLDDPI